MILLAALIAGLAAGVGRAWYTKRRLSLSGIPALRSVWLVPIAFIPQWLAFYFVPTGRLVGIKPAAVGLVASLVLLLLFAWINRNIPGFWLLGLGLSLNLLVIVLNGGLMPIRPEAVRQLMPDASPDAWQVGRRLGTSKDIVLPIADTRVWWLSDRFLTPRWFPYRVAFSLGDVFIAAGVFWTLWTMGGTEQERNK